MDDRRVKDVMVSLSEYPVVSEYATLGEAVLALEMAQRRLPAGRQPYRAVLVVDEKKRVVGKIGQLSFLRALEPRYGVMGNLDSLFAAGVSEELVASMMEHYRFFEEKLSDLCSRSSRLLAKDVMRPVTQSIDENATLREAIHRIVMWQTLSILVTRGSEVVGLVRLSELFDAIAAQLKAAPG
jgi:CBS domain containing-hemolysin-like protein